MVQLKLTSFKTGTRYNPSSYFKMNNLTSTQKLELVRCRIWGNTIGDNQPSGNFVLYHELRFEKNEK